VSGLAAPPTDPDPDRRQPLRAPAGPVRAVLAGGAAALLGALAVFAATVVAAHRTPAAPVPPPAVARSDATLRPVRAGVPGPDWQDWSWAASVGPRQRAPDGTAAVRVEFTDGFAGFSLRQSEATRPVRSASVSARVWVEGSGTWLGLTVQTDDRSPGLHGPDVRVPGGRWVTLTVPLRSIGAPAEVQRVTVEHRSAALRGAHRPVRVWVADLTLG
jgi:hypothetical protein